MAALSDYLESGLLHHVFRGASFPKPSAIVVALTTGVPLDSHTGSTIPEVPLTINGSGTGYSRLNLGDPTISGNIVWNYNTADHNAGSGLIKNGIVFSFQPALCDWGGLSGIAIVDNPNHGSGNLLMHATLNNPRQVYLGDSIQFDLNNFQVKFE
jgi:hypothetical protein